MKEEGTTNETPPPTMGDYSAKIAKALIAALLLINNYLVFTYIPKNKSTFVRIPSLITRDLKSLSRGGDI